MRRLRVLALGFIALLSLASAPACTATANVSDLWTSIDEDGSRRRQLFFTDTKKIYCVAELGVGRDDVTLKIYLRQTQIRDPETKNVRDTNIVGGFLDFHPKKGNERTKEILVFSPANPTTGAEDPNAPFPAGRFVCEAVLDGELQKAVTFNIDFPECPERVIANNEKCFGFYELGRECKAAGLTGSPNEGKCVCEKAGWKCDTP